MAVATTSEARTIRTPIAAPRAVRRGGAPLLGVLFVVSLAWPAAYAFALGSVTLSPYRILLLIGVAALGVQVLRGKLRLTTADYLVGFFAFWTATSVMLNHGLFTPFTSYSARDTLTSVGYEAAAIAILESAGAYFLARVAVIGPVQFATVMQTFGWVTLGVCAFAVIEAKTGVNAFGLNATAGVGDVRFGLHRAAGPFPHSILWGLFAAASFAFFASRSVRGWGALSPLFVIASLAGIVTSVSTTAVTAIAIQAIGLGWGWIARIKRKWTYLVIGLVSAYLVLDLVSARTAFEVVMSRMSFSQWNGYVRLIQWDYGWRNVMENPFFGIGFADWTRPTWLAGSIDSYWLVLAVRHGMVAPALLIAVIVLLLMQASRAYRGAASPKVLLLVRVWAVTVVSLAVAGVSVHFWGQAAVLFFFLLGCISGFSSSGQRARLRS